MHRTFATAAIATGLTVLAAPAAADAPPVVPVQGTLTDAAGAPIDGTVTIVATIYDAPTDGAVLYQETAEVVVDRGSFTLYLGAVQPLDLSVFRDVGTAFLGLQVGEDAEMRPRLQLGSAPYAGFAQWAGDAETLGGQRGSDFASFGHGHDWSDLSGIPAGIADGDDDTTYDGSDFALSGQSCPPGDVADGINAAGTLTCTPDANTTYDGSDFALSGQSCGAGQRVIGISANGNVVCQSVTVVPSGLIAFFAGPCPAGFQEYTALRGRVVVGTPDGGDDEGMYGTELGDLGARVITQVPSHTHTVNPPPAGTSAAGGHGHAFYTANNDANNATSQGYPAGNNHLAFRTTDRRQRTENNGDIRPAGIHTHVVDIGAFSTGATGAGAVDVTMPYVQLRACIAQ